MKNIFVILGAGVALTACVSPYGWSEAPMASHHYGSGAPVSWWGQDAASVDLFYGALSGYGHWANHTRYGRIFFPNGVGRDWQPYSRGYWRNDSRWGRTWVSQEPFGWATYHYGRWGHDSQLGWFWVPDTRFGASWVNWRESGGYSSWSPMAPMGWGTYGHAVSDYWWVHAPSSWAYRPGMHNHVRPGRPDGHWGNGRPNRPDSRPNRPNYQGKRDADDVAGSFARQRILNGGQAASRPPASKPQTVRPDGQQSQKVKPPRQPRSAAQAPRPSRSESRPVRSNGGGRPASPPAQER